METNYRYVSCNQQVAHTIAKMMFGNWSWRVMMRPCRRRGGKAFSVLRIFLITQKKSSLCSDSDWFKFVCFSFFPTRQAVRSFTNNKSKSNQFLPEPFQFNIVTWCESSGQDKNDRWVLTTISHFVAHWSHKLQKKEKKIRRQTGKSSPAKDRNNIMQREPADLSFLFASIHFFFFILNFILSYALYREKVNEIKKSNTQPNHLLLLIWLFITVTPWP